MKLTARLAIQQLKKNRSRSIWTLIGIAFSCTVITALFSFAASGTEMLAQAFGRGDIFMSEWRNTLIGLSVFLSLIIIATSVIVVSNAFRVSASEQTRQFGILKSAGATKKQITQIVVYESLFLSAIGIPAGIIVGLLIELFGVNITNFFIAGINALDPTGTQVNFHFVVAWQAVIVSALIALATVFVSALIPARKAAKIPAIEAIRSTGEVKLKAKQVRTNRLVQKAFGVEGALASKSLKRSKRNFRATVVSLTISIILFIIASDITTQAGKMSDMMFKNVEATVMASAYSSFVYHYYDDSDAVDYIEYSVIHNETADEITAKLREFSGESVMGVGQSGLFYTVNMPREMLTPQMRQALIPYGFEPNQEEYKLSVELITTDPETYTKLCQAAGVPIGSNILINQSNDYLKIDNKRAEFTPFVFSEQTVLLTGAYNEPSFELRLHGELGIGDIPSEVLLSAQSSFNVVVAPQADSLFYRWFANVTDKAAFMEYADTLLRESVVQTSEARLRFDVFDVEEATKAIRDLAYLVSVFVFGFVGFLILIGLTNVISTMSTNVRSRAKEFAVLQSVGMTQSGLYKMINLESILCSLKSLLIGLPLGVASTWVIYQILMQTTIFAYSFPWLAVLYCIIGIFALTWVTMRHAVSRLQNGNIIETIRGVG